jgi:hypothetical protein
VRLRDRKRGKSDPDRRNKTLRMIDARYENVQQAIFLNSLLGHSIDRLYPGAWYFWSKANGSSDDNPEYALALEYKHDADYGKGNADIMKNQAKCKAPVKLD